MWQTAIFCPFSDTFAITVHFVRIMKASSTAWLGHIPKRLSACDRACSQHVTKMDLWVSPLYNWMLWSHTRWVSCTVRNLGTQLLHSRPKVTACKSLSFLTGLCHVCEDFQLWRLNHFQTLLLPNYEWLWEARLLYFFLQAFITFNTNITSRCVTQGGIQLQTLMWIFRYLQCNVYF